MKVMSKPFYYDLLTIVVRALVNISLKIYIYIYIYILMLGLGTSINLCCFGNMVIF